MKISKIIESVWLIGIGIMLGILISIDKPQYYREYHSNPTIEYLIEGKPVLQEVWDTINWWDDNDHNPETGFMYEKTIRIYNPGSNPKGCEECGYRDLWHDKHCSQYDSALFNWWYNNQSPIVYGYDF